MSYTRIGRGLAVMLALAGVALSGCTSEEHTILKDELEKGITETLRDSGHKPEKVECPGPVNAEMAERTECVLTKDGGKRYHIDVVVTSSVQGGKAEYHIEVDAKPMS